MDVLKAEELFREFREVSITEFFKKNKAHLGYSGKIRSLTTVVHELVTNSLDACEEARILPDILVEIRQLGDEHYMVKEVDNGPGILPKRVPDVFGKMLAGTKFHRNIQLRGQQGIGVAGVTMFSQMTSGKPIKVKTSIGNGKVHEFELMIDISKNKAEVLDHLVYDENWRGTQVECELKGVKFSLGEQGPYEYVRRTAIANPHARIVFIDPNGKKTIFERSSDTIPKPPIEIKPHPKGITVDDLFHMAKSSTARKVSSFLVSSFARMSPKKVKEIQSKVSFDLDKNPRKLTWQECEEIIKAIQEIKFLAPSTEGLSPIGEEQIRKAVINILDPEFDAILTRPPKTYSGGIPFQVEVAIAYGGSAGRRINTGVKFELMRFANKTPLLFDAGGCAITKAVTSVDWKRYGIPDYENAPLTILVNLISTYIPYTSAGKQSIADEKEIVREIRMALMEVGRKFQVYHSRKRRAMEREQKKQILLKYSQEVANALAYLTDEDAEKIKKDLEELIERKIEQIAIEEEEEMEEELMGEKDTIETIENLGEEKEKIEVETP